MNNNIINDNTYNLLFTDKSNDEELTMSDIAQIDRYYTLDYFTKEKHSDNYLLFDDIEKKLSKITYNINTKKYKYEIGDKVISFQKLSDLLYDDYELQDELTSDNRRKKCHEKSIFLSMFVDNSNVVTGYMNIAGTKILHSILEYNVDEKDFIIDWTTNLVLSREDFDYLTKFEELNKIDCNKYTNDMSILLKDFSLDLKVYLTFRDELMNDLLRNKDLFNKEKTKVKKITI